MNKKLNIENFLADTQDIIFMESPSDNREKVNLVANYFLEKFISIGWNARLIETSNKVGKCLFATNTNDGDYDILIVGHMDTVYPVGTIKDKIKIVGNRAYSPSICDMKSNIMLNYYVCKELMNYEEKPKICVFYNSDEEISSAYSKDLIMELAKKSKYVMVLEGAGLNGELVNKRKGLAKFQLMIEGKEAHAGVNHESGLNSIDEFAKITTRLHSLTNYVSKTTVNVGVVRGGTKANVVPKETYAEIDIRFENQLEYEKILKEIDELTKVSISKGFKTEFIVTGMRPPMNFNQETEKFMDLVEKTSENLGIKVKWVARAGGSDANFTANVGTPTLDGFGPRSGNPHNSEQEYIIIDDIDYFYNLMINILRSIAIKKI